MKKTELTDKALCVAVSEMENGLCDANLGSNVFKKRIALPSRGKSGSVRTLIASNYADKWFFMFGFKKSDRGNISKKEKEALQMIAGDLLGLSQMQIDNHIKNGLLQEICNDHKKN